MYSENEDFNEEYNEETQNSNNKIKDFYENNKKMVLILGGLLLLLLLLLMMNSCSNNTNNGGTNNNKEKIAIIVTSDNDGYLSLGSSTRLIASLDPKDAYTDPNYKWSSEDDRIASVDGLGNVTGNNLGQTSITVSFINDKGEEFKTTYTIYVIEGNKDVQVTDAKFPEGEILITRGDSYQLTKEITPSNGYIEKVVYTSSDTNIVKVDEDGKIKALNDGIATIKMVVNDKFNSEIVVNVISDNVDPQIIINPEKIEVDNEMNILVNDTAEIIYQVSPSNAYVEDLKWSSSDDRIVIVDDEGVITAKSEGLAIITVTTRNGLNDKIKVNVEKGVVKVNAIELLSSNNLSLAINQTANILVNVLPNDAANKHVTYDSSNNAVATVSDDGTILAVGDGYATITVTTVDGSYKTSVNVSVTGGSSSSGGSSGGSSSGGSSSGGSITCNSESIIRISSDSGGAITSDNKNGTGVTITKNVVNIDTSNISSSCGAVRNAKYCYGTSACNPNTSFNVGDSFAINFPSGEGIMQLSISVNVDSQTYQKTYYMKYNVASGAGSPPEEEPTTDKGTLDLTWEYHGKAFYLGYGNVVFGKVIYKGSKEFKNIYVSACDMGIPQCGDGDISSLVMASAPNKITYESRQYYSFPAKKIYKFTTSQYFKSSSTLVGLYEGQYLCARVEFKGEGKISDKVKCISAKVK